MTAINGACILLAVDTTDAGNYVEVGMQKNATLNMNTDTIDAAYKVCGANLWKAYIPGYKDWSVDADALIVETDTALVHLETHFMAGTTIPMALKTPASATKWTGTAIIKSLKYSAPDGGLYTAAISLQGTGALVKV